MEDANFAMFWPWMMAKARLRYEARRHRQEQERETAPNKDEEPIKDELPEQEAAPDKYDVDYPEAVPGFGIDDPSDASGVISVYVESSAPVEAEPMVDVESESSAIDPPFKSIETDTKPLSDGKDISKRMFSKLSRSL